MSPPTRSQPTDSADGDLAGLAPVNDQAYAEIVAPAFAAVPAESKVTRESAVGAAGENEITGTGFPLPTVTAVPAK